jgi:hypothetical protein
MESDRLSLLFKLVEYCDEKERQATETLNSLSYIPDGDFLTEFELGWLGIKKDEK